MANDRRGGLGGSTSNLLRPTTPPDSEPAPEPADDAGAEQGGATADDAGDRPKGRPPRRKAAKRKGHKFSLSAEVFFRLNQRSLETGEDLSTTVEKILDRNLPRYTVHKAG